MIKNGKQYKISKKRLAELEQTIALKQSKALPNSKEEGALNSLTRIKNDKENGYHQCCCYKSF